MWSAGVLVMGTAVPPDGGASTDHRRMRPRAPVVTVDRMLPLPRTTPAVATAFAVIVSCSLLAGACSDDATSSAIATPAAPVTTTPATTTPATTGPERDDARAVAATRAIFSSIADDDPGCTVAVGRGGDVVFAEAYGASRLDPLAPMTSETVVDIGSTSKQFTATAIALLAEDGRVDLDAPLATYVSDLPTWSEQVTVRQLIHHRSGIEDYIVLLVQSGVALTDPADDADALRVLNEATRLRFEPGTGWEYSNSNYFLLAQVVLNVTGDDLGTYLARTVFEPLGLRAVMDPTAAIAGKATSYGDASGTWQVADSPWTQLGDGGVQTTPSELVRWASQYWAPTIGGPDINTIRFDDAVLVDSGDASAPRYGFGMIEFDLDGRRVLTHSGGWGGFVTTFVVVPDEQLVVMGTCTAPESVPVTDSGDFGIDILRAWLDT
jgi:CubicO group peptidase (beta-lactamase class C family)